MKKILITGANGLLGQALVEIFAGHFQVTATSREGRAAVPAAGVAHRSLDIRDARACKSMIRELQPDAIINAAAYTNVDGCELEKSLCWEVNVKGVENLAQAARRNMALLVQLSTDYIFDGTNGPYGEDDPPHPLGYYGKSKLAAENVVRMTGIPYAIIRTNVIYGTGSAVKNNFFLWIYHSLKAGKTINVVTDQFNNPILAQELAEGIRLLVDKSQYGVYHLAGKAYLSRYEFAVQVADVFGFPREQVRPVTTAELGQTAPRPMRGGLKIDLAMRELGFAPAPLQAVLTSLKSNVEAG